MKFVVFHGAFGSPESNWIPELEEKLKTLGQEVVVPRFPVDDWDVITRTGKTYVPQKQGLKNWFKAFESTMKSFRKGEDLCFVGHSLGPLFILHCVEKYNIKLDSAIFVSPFLRKLNRSWQIDVVNSSFYKTDFDFRKLKQLIPVSYVLYSDNDPYVDKVHSIGFAKRLGSSLLFVKKAGHMNREMNLNEFPLVFELCKTRLDLSLYLKYIAHRKELYSVDYIDPKSEEVVYLEPHEVFDEGAFKFRNLRKSGFCTFYTAIDFWNTQSAYYNQARKAARRIENFIRVFIVDRLSDLEKPLLQEQIRLDFQAGIKCLLCMAKVVRSKIPELDFGIWDGDYLCIVRLDKEKYVEVKLSSRKKDIKEAESWEKVILSKATLIKNFQKDIDTFIKKNRKKNEAHI